MKIFQSRMFWTLVAGLVAFVVKFFWAGFPLTDLQILDAILFLLGLFGVVTSIRGALPAGSILLSLAFWQMIVGLLSFVLNFFVPNIPVSAEMLLAIVLFLLGLFDIKPELKARGII